MDILPQLLLNGLIAGSIYALSGVGLTLSYGLLRILNFAHGHLLMIGAYAFYFAAANHEMSVVEAGLFTAVTTLLLATLSYKLFIAPFSRTNAILTLVSTLALANVFESCVSMLFGVNVRSMPSESLGSSIEFGGLYITPIQIVILCSAVVLISVLAVLVHSTTIGRKFRALNEHPAAAQSLGINRQRVSTWVFILGALLAAYAGVLIGYETNVQPTMGATYTIKAFATMILGGLGNIWGTLIASYLLGLIENLSIGVEVGGYSLPAGYKDAFSFVIILLTLLIRPQGLFGARTRSA